VRHSWLQAIKNHWNSTLFRRREQILAESGRRAGMKRSAEDDEDDSSESKRAKTDGGCPTGVVTPMAPAIVAQGFCATPACAVAHTKHLLVLEALLAGSPELEDFKRELEMMEKTSGSSSSVLAAIPLDDDADDDMDYGKKEQQTLQSDDIDIACSSPEDDVEMEVFGVCIEHPAEKLDRSCFAVAEDVSIAELGRMDASLDDYEVKDEKMEVQEEDSYSSAETSPAWEKPESPCYPDEPAQDCSLARDGCVSPTSFLEASVTTASICVLSKRALGTPVSVLPLSVTA
jgi:hypothetical protein